MFALEPPASPWDLRFRLLGCPIRVHWMFWILALLLNPSPRQDLKGSLVWLSAVFISIVVHEMGHALAFRLFGHRSRIVLYGMGGVTIPEASDFRAPRLTPLRNVVVSFAGPAAGFLLVGAILAALSAAGVRFALVPGLVPQFVFDRFGPSEEFRTLIISLVFVNVMWGLFNLLPIYPLDGGQIARGFLQAARLDRALEISHALSIVFAIGLGLLLWDRSRSVWNALLCAYLAYINYQALTALRGRRDG